MIIEQCKAWYQNELIDDFHKRKTLQGQEYVLSRMNFAKRCCADDANLCEVVSVAPAKENASQQFIDDILSNNRFRVRYREQLEKTSAHGTVGAYIYLKNAKYMEYEDGFTKIQGGDIRINYVDAENIIPLTVDNGLVTEVAFTGTNIRRGKKETTLVIFTQDENNNYIAETVKFDNQGKEVPEQYSKLQLGEVKPFSIMQVAEVNNVPDMDGYGLPKIYNAIPLFKAFDLCYMVLYGDLDKAEKIVLVNELLCEFDQVTGKPKMTSEQKKVFMLLGEKLPDEKSVVQEYNPEIRIEQITKCFELVLSLISMQFGYGTKKYSFENGQIQTATQYIGERQDMMQELNKQRQQASDYVTDILRACMWFSNAFSKTNYNVDEDLSIEFDDSYIEDRVSKLESMRADALSFPEVPVLRLWYLMEKYNLSEEEAQGYVENLEEPVDDLED